MIPLDDSDNVDGDGIAIDDECVVHSNDVISNSVVLCDSNCDNVSLCVLIL